MSGELFECVPNVSEGRDYSKVEFIASSLRMVQGLSVLDVDSSYDANRTVFTFVGGREAVVEGAYQLVRAAAEVCDMRNHKGTHPRLGAVDVCPFVPLRDATLEDCVDLAQRVAVRVWRDFKLPVFFYGAAANRPERVRLEDIRRGEYESLKERLYRVEWEPDVGEAYFNEKLGATVIGARKILIAYNVNLESRDLLLARRIAGRIRESGVLERLEGGRIRRKPGLLKSCKAIGWYLPHLNRAQVSINLTDFETTGLHTAYEAVRAVSKELGTSVTGSEIVGLVPKRALLVAGEYYASLSGRKITGSESPECEKQKVEAAVAGLNLSELHSFDPREKILEELIARI